MEAVIAKLRVTLTMDARYAQHHTDTEISEALESRLLYSLGFRAAEVKRFKCTVERG